ncbi:MAG: MarR family transcriptional regulator, partial [Methanobrevibacter sp.]|nr:MarR family transcriptional regulator [Methanobrevibacter sp.]
EDEGFVERKKSEENRRKYIIFFTPKGRKVALKIEKLNNHWENKLLNEFCSFEKKEFMKKIRMLSLKSIEIMKE